MDLVGEPRIQVRLRPDWRLARSAAGGSLLARRSDGKEIALADWVAHFAEANRRLATGAPLAALRDCVAAAGGVRHAVAYLVLVQEWCRHGLLEFPLDDGDGERAVLVPQWSGYVPALAREVPPAGRRLHRFAYLRDEGSAWSLQSPLCGARLRFARLAVLDEPLVRRALAAGEFLEGDRQQTDARRRALAQWEFHDLLFHFRQRGGWQREPRGARFPFVGSIDPLPAARPAWSGAAVELPRAADAGDDSFARILERRRSARQYDETRTISLDDLGVLLDRCARIRSQEVREVPGRSGNSASLEITRRPYPSGGASYELEIYPIVDRCTGLAPGAYHYDAGRHRLVRIAGRTPEVAALIADAKAATGGQADPQVLLAISARFARVMWKYRAISYGIILRNTGALYQTLYLAATALGLAPCALGSGDSALFARLTGLDPVVEGTVGEFILGGRPRRHGR